MKTCLSALIAFSASFLLFSCTPDDPPPPLDQENPKGAYFNKNGCLVCSDYSVGDSLILRGNKYYALSRSGLDAYLKKGKDAKYVCTSLIKYMGRLRTSSPNFNGDISSWDVGQVTDMSYMFANATNFNQDIGNWDVSHVTNMGGMFKKASRFNQDISRWDVSQVKRMFLLFAEADSFNQDIGNWDVSQATNFWRMFDNATSFNQDIGNWDVSQATNMVEMFNNATSFNQDLSGWCVSSITSLPGGFKANSALTNSNTPVWGTCPP